MKKSVLCCILLVFILLAGCGGENGPLDDSGPKTSEMKAKKKSDGTKLMSEGKGLETVLLQYEAETGGTDYYGPKCKTADFEKPEMLASFINQLSSVNEYTDMNYLLKEHCFEFDKEKLKPYLKGKVASLEDFRLLYLNGEDFVISTYTVEDAANLYNGSKIIKK